MSVTINAAFIVSPQSRKTRHAKTTRTVSDVLRDLGDIDTRRVRWHKLGRATVADAIKVNEQEKGSVELIDGILVEKAIGSPEGILAASIIEIIGAYARAHNLGIVGGPNTLMQLCPELLRIPDVSFFSWERLQGKVPTQAAPVIAPDLAIEVISPGNTSREMSRKCQEYFKFGVTAVWMIYRESKSVKIYSSPNECVTLTGSDVISGGTVLPRFSLEVHTLFLELDRIRN